LAAQGFPTALNVFPDPTDVSAPTVTSISILPAAVDVSAGFQDITGTLDVTDHLSGTIFTPSAAGSFFGFFPGAIQKPIGSAKTLHRQPGIHAYFRYTFQWKVGSDI